MNYKLLLSNFPTYEEIKKNSRWADALELCIYSPIVEIEADSLEEAKYVFRRDHLETAASELILRLCYICRLFDNGEIQAI